MEFLLAALSPINILYSFLGTFIGICFGIIPGLTATMGVVLFLPFTFSMEAISAFAMLLGIFCGGIYGGSITAILIRTPGTPSSAATALDGYPLTVQGKAVEALSSATIASFIGGIFSCVTLIILAPQLADLALEFGAAEYFAVGLFGLSIVTNLSGKNVAKGLISVCLGLMVAMVGLDGLNGMTRFTFGSRSLLSGISEITALIGLFAISEVFCKLEASRRVSKQTTKVELKGHIVRPKVFFKDWFNVLRASVIGTGIGIIPATGSGVASWMSYAEAKRTSKEPEKFGNGALSGVVASEAANNAVTGGAMVPLLTLGIPGDVVTAVLLGALMIQGITPGPTMFTTNIDVVYGIYAMLICANIFMLILGLSATRLFALVLKAPSNILSPVVICLCFVGSFAIRNSQFDMHVALAMGILGYVFIKADIPLPPMLLGIILEDILESNFRRAMIISDTGFGIFFTSPISLLFLVLSMLMFLLPVYRMIKAKRVGNKTVV